MATKTAPTKDHTDAPPAKLIRDGLVLISDISVDGNIRKKFDDGALKELAANIKTCGVINPVTLRPDPKHDGRFDLVGGERRLRAATMAGLTSIPARVFELNDHQKLEYQAAENIHRKDLTPIEEARAFKTLLDSNQYTVPQLADLVDKSDQYVYRSIRLLELRQDIIDAIESGQITPAHGHQILRMPEDARDGASEFALKPDWDESLPTARQLQEFISRTVARDLEAAPFSKACCGKCDFNSGNQGQLFDGAERGTCTRPECFAEKTQQHFDSLVEPLRKRFPDAQVLIVEYGIWKELNHKGYVAIAKLPASVKALKPGTAILYSKQNGEAWTAVKPEPSKAKSGTAQKPMDPREAFISEKVCDDLDSEYNRLIRSCGEDDLVKFFRNHEGWAIAQTSKELKLNRKKLEAEDCLRVAVASMVHDDDPLAKDVIDMLGGNSKKLITEARKKYAAEYDATVNKAKTDR